MPKIKLHPFFTRNKIAFLSLALIVMSVGVGWSITSLELTQLQDPTINLATTAATTTCKMADCNAGKAGCTKKTANCAAANPTACKALGSSCSWRITDDTTCQKESKTVNCSMADCNSKRSGCQLTSGSGKCSLPQFDDGSKNFCEISGGKWQATAATCFGTYTTSVEKCTPSSTGKCLGTITTCSGTYTSQVKQDEKIKDGLCLNPGQTCQNGVSYFDPKCFEPIQERCGINPNPKPSPSPSPTPPDFTAIAKACQNQNYDKLDELLIASGLEAFGGCLSNGVCKSDIRQSTNEIVLYCEHLSGTCSDDASCGEGRVCVASTQNPNLRTCQNITGNATGNPCHLQSTYQGIQEDYWIGHDQSTPYGLYGQYFGGECIQYEGKFTGYLLTDLYCNNGSLVNQVTPPGQDGNSCPRDLTCNTFPEAGKNSQAYKDMDCDQTSQTPTTTARKAKKLNLDTLVKFFNSIF